MEEDMEIAKILLASCEEKNAHHGSMGIYYPGISAPNKIIPTGRYEGKGDILIDRIASIVYRYVNQ